MFRKIAVVVNASKPGALSFAETLKKLFDSEHTKSQVFTEYPIDESVLCKYDLIVTVGGDGTILGIAAVAAKFEIPVFAVNHGEIGFLSTTDREHVPQQIEKLKNNNFKLSNRSMLNVSLNGARYSALNDVVIRNKNCVRLIKLAANFNKNLVAEYRADGLIIASPTGSTAYNFSAGGPIVHPGFDCLILTPICQHDRHTRSLVLPNSGSLAVKRIDGEFAVYCDSNLVGYAREAIVTVSEKKLQLVEAEDLSFFDILRKKL
ncbi:MAG: NAD(+)/NADH kinase [Puniceicoccales bacterium]|jgi:NAD+ kinase|nr:NAD(+)/NADH kinase [Puniceicoccales bacterium]